MTQITEPSTKFTQTGSVLGLDAHWQMPAITEKHAYDLVLAKRWRFDSVLYLGFPWATLIDGLDRGTQIGSVLKHAVEDLVMDGKYKRIITVCQHIKFRNHLSLFKNLGVSDIFASHAKVGERVLDGINIHPFPLFPVQATGSETIPESAKEALEAFNKRKYQYSFVGAFNPHHYLTNSRELIFNLPRNNRSFVLDRHHWHFENRVYNEQIYGEKLSAEELAKETSDAEEYVRVLKDTKFSLCPSGTGPNSIRLWESIEFGCIPVILADDLRLPGKHELWEDSCVILRENEESIINLPNLLEALQHDEQTISEKLDSLAQIRQLYGRDGFISDVENLARDIEEACNRTRPMAAKYANVFYLEVKKLDNLAIVGWIYYINIISCLLKIKSLVFIDRDELQELASYSGLFPWVDLQLKSHGFSQCLDWTKESLAHISDSCVLSTRLFDRFSQILISAKEKPQLVNPRLFDDICLLKQQPNRVLNERCPAYSDFVKSSVLDDLVEWEPVCSILTSMFDGDEFVEGFLENSSAFSAYEDMEHFIIRPASPGQEHHKVLEHAGRFRGVVYIWLHYDPGLYQVWNECCRLSSSRHLTNANIDDRRDPEHVVKLTHVLDNHQDVDVASSALRITDTRNLAWKDSENCTVWYANEPMEKYGADRLMRLQNGKLIAYNMPHCMPVWRCFLHTVNGYFNERAFGPSSDWEFWLRAGRCKSGFYLLSQPLGLYFRSNDSYWRRTSNASEFDRSIVELYSDANMSFVADNQATSIASCIAGMLNNRRQNQDLAFLFGYFQLVKSIDRRPGGGKHLEELIDHIERKFLYSTVIRTLADEVYPGLTKSGVDGCLMEFVRFLVDVTHSLHKLNPEGRKKGFELIWRVCTELHVGTDRVEPLLIKAYLSRLDHDHLKEKYFLRRVYKKFPAMFWNHFQSVYRFSESLEKVSVNLGNLPEFGDLTDINPGQSLFFFPDYTHGNPYQSLLYENLGRSGVRLQGVNDLDDLDSGKISFNRGDICHIHWINIVLKDVDEDSLESVISDFLKCVASLKNKGMSVYWTVHNRYSHDFQDQELEKTFRERLYALADRVFIHHPMLLDQLHEWLPDARKVECIEHGNYIGRYSNQITSKEARLQLGLRPDDLVLSVLGQVRPYKDLHKLLPVINEAMAQDQRLKLVVAGKINCEKTIAGLAQMPQDQVLVKNEFIKDDQIQNYIKPASFVLLSYRDILTSGSLFQAFSFGAPVIAPSLGSIPAYVVDGWNGFLYESPEELGKILNDFKKLSKLKVSTMGENGLTSIKSISWP
jgi:glycosyltransferase involved in cell wall biosynthesis